MRGSVEHGRAAFARRSWGEAYTQLSAAEHAPLLDVGHLERLAVAAFLVGRDVDSTSAWERAHHACVRVGDTPRAARCAFWLAIATQLGSGTTSLYRHITHKAELIELMVDAVYGERPLPPEPGDDWRAGLAAVARGFRASLLEHPWLAQQASRRPALGPNVIARLDHALAIVDRFTHDATRANMIVSAVNTYVLGSVANELAEREAQRSTGMTEEEWRASVGAYIRHVVDSGRYPFFNRRILDADDPDADARFEFGLDCLLRGIASGGGASAAPGA
jgi:AcrR family transcriptional regulator